MRTARKIAASSNPLNTNGIGNGPMKNEQSTSTGATNSAIWVLEPMAMLTARSILSFIATETATQCSAALPTIATTMTPMKNSDRPRVCDAAEVEQTRTYYKTPVETTDDTDLMTHV